MKPDVKKSQNTVEFYFREGCYISELSNSAEDPDLSIARARVQPGVTTRWHRLAGISERYVVLEGEGLVELDDQPGERVTAGDFVAIPPLTRQRITNPGTTDLVFLAICTPRFMDEAYESLEHTD